MWRALPRRVLAGLLDESDGDENPGPQEDESQQDDGLRHTQDDH